MNHGTVDCGLHGSKPWTLECICKECSRIYRPQTSGQPDTDGPFIEMEFGFNPDQRFCECGEMLLDWSMGPDDVRLCQALGMICRKCMREEIREAKHLRVGVNDPVMLERRSALRQQRQN